MNKMAKSRKKTKKQIKTNPILQAINKLKNNYHALFFITVMLFLITLAFAEESGITEAMIALCGTARTFLSIGVMLMIIMAAVVYSVGQMLGAETRARASVWATAMMTGAVIGILIYIIVPWMIGMMAPDLDVETACGEDDGGSNIGSQESGLTGEEEDAPRWKPPERKPGLPDPIWK